MTLDPPLKRKAMEAFNRTAAHPVDPRVRLTCNPDDLAAIHCDGVSAVIWQREMPAAVHDALAGLGEGWFEKTVGSLAVNVSGFKTLQDEYGKQNLPAPICADILDLSALFLRVSGCDPRNVREMVNYQQGVAPEYELFKPIPFLPHTDGYSLRLGTVFSRARGMGTQWHPRNVTDDAFEKRAPLSRREIEAIKKAYGIQQIETGHVVIFKGERHHTYPARDHFCHSTPLPVQGVARMGYFVGAY